MADITITSLPGGSTPLGPEYIALDQAGSTVKLSLSDLFQQGGEESITSLSFNNNTLTYTDESGLPTNIDLSHTHTISNITDLQTSLDGKIGETEINTSHFTFSNNTLSLKTIQEGQIATDAITTTKIADSNVTAAKLSSDALTAAVTAAVAAAYPVGSIYINATNATNPATLLGFGTWVAFGAGRVPVGIDSGDTDFDTAEETGGAKTHTLTEDEMPSHNHTVEAAQWIGGYTDDGGSPDQRSVTTDIPSTSTGGDQPHNNIQPYIVVYMWKRTA